MRVRRTIEGDLEHAAGKPLILNRRFLDDEQLIRAEQLAVLEEIFNENVRQKELRRLSSHFGPMLRKDHPFHLAVWGKTGTGKTLTLSFFLNVLANLCRKRSIAMRHVHLDLSTPRPCFRALNDLACLLNASKRYRKGISLEELMLRIEDSLQKFAGYLVLFIDEVDHVRRERDTFMAFLVRRLPQCIPGKLILVFASNRLDWSDHLDPRVKSFLKLNELVFKPYDADDLQRILAVRVEKALCPQAVQEGVIEKISALASREHGDARQAVMLLARSAQLAEISGAKSVSLDIVDEASREIEQDRYTNMIRTAPAQLRASLGAIIEENEARKGHTITTREAYEAYKRFCSRIALTPLAGRAFGDLVSELDMYAFISSRIISRGRFGRSREITIDLPKAVVQRIHAVICLGFEIRQGKTPNH